LAGFEKGQALILLRVRERERERRKKEEGVDYQILFIGRD
jgi:hypothetical protein